MTAADGVAKLLEVAGEALDEDRDPTEDEGENTEDNSRTTRD